MDDIGYLHKCELERLKASVFLSFFLGIGLVRCIFNQGTKVLN